MKPQIDYTLYLCTDRNLMTTDTIEESVELAIKGGVTVVQLREKECTSKEFYEQAVRVKTITDAYEVPLIINDRVDIALAVGADGVHLGQKDLPIRVARDLMGPDRILGVTANTKERAIEAVKSGADYIGAGDVFGTSTKHISGTNIIGSRFDSLNRPFFGIRRHTQNTIRPHKIPCHADRKIFLSQMHTVGSYRQRNINAVIDDKRHFIRIRDRLHTDCLFIKFF